MIPVYPWPFHSEYYRRRQVLDDRRRVLNALGFNVYPNSSEPSAGFALAEAIQSDPFAANDITWQQTGATPLMPGDAESPFTANIRTGDYAAIIPDWYKSAIPQSSSGPTTRTVIDDRAYAQVQNYAAESVVRTAPYFGWLATLVSVTPANFVSGVLIYRPSFSPALTDLGPVQRTYLGNYYRLGYDGTIHFEGQTTASVHRLVPWFASSMWIDRHTLNAQQSAEVDTFIANNLTFSDLTEYAFDSPITTGGPARDDLSKLTTVSWNIAKPQGGRWIEIGYGCLIGEDHYRYVATQETYQPGSTFSGRIVQQDGAYALEEDGRLWLHDLRSNARFSIGTNVLTFYRDGSEAYAISKDHTVTPLPPEPHTL